MDEISKNKSYYNRKLNYLYKVREVCKIIKDVKQKDVYVPYTVIYEIYLKDRFYISQSTMYRMLGERFVEKQIRDLENIVCIGKKIM